MFYKSHKKSASRAFDHLYDPLYIVADRRDIQRENTNALIQTAPINLYPVYDTMFTDLPQKPRIFYTLQQNPLPKQPEFPSIKTVSNQIRNTVNLTNYVNVPIGNIRTLNLKLDITNKIKGTERRAETVERKPHSVACQTMYREQSAQTRPYLPSPKPCDNSTSEELVRLARLYASEGPPGVFEVEMVERERKILKWEKALNDLVGSSDWSKKREILEAIEWENLLAKEQEIEKRQLQRLLFVENALKERTDCNLGAFTDVISDSIDRLTFDRNQKMKKANKKYNRSMRRIQNCLAKIRGDTNNIQEPSVLHKNNGKVDKYKSEYLLQPSNLYEHPLEICRTPQCIEPKNNIDRFKSVKKTHLTASNEINLRKTYESLKALRLQNVIFDAMNNCLKALKNADRYLEHNKIQAKISTLLEHASEINQITNRLETCSVADDLDHLDNKLRSLLSMKNNEKSDSLRMKDLDLSDETLQSRQEDFDYLHQNVTRAQNNAAVFCLESLLLDCFTDIADKHTQMREQYLNIPSKVNLSRNTSANTKNKTDRPYTSEEIVSDFIDNCFWPELIENIKTRDERKQILVDMKQLTPERPLEDDHSMSPPK